jgi:WD40 repeat protein
VSDVFVSYSRRDSEFVHSLASDLEQRGKSVWIDTEGIGDGEVFPDAIRHAIEQADAFVFVITPDSVASTFCETEVSYAEQLQKRMVPVLREPVEDDGLPEAIRVRSWIPYTPDVDAATASDRLIAALDTDLEHTHAHTRWLVKALDWETHGRDSSFLLRGTELAAADAWLAGVGDGVEPQPTALQRDYIYASRNAASRRQRLLLLSAIAVAVVSLVLVVFAVISRNQAVSARSKATSEAVQATSRAWAAESIAQLPIDSERSILLAVAAVHKSPTPEAVFALRRALDVSPLRVRLPGVGSQSTPFYWGPGVSYSPDGSRIAEGSQDGAVRIFDATSGAVLRRIAVGSAAPIVQYSPDGSRLAVASTRGALLVDPATGRILERTSESAFNACDLVFSPDGSALYFSNYLENRPLYVSNLYRWNLRTGRVQRLAHGDIGGVGGGVGGGGFFFEHLTPDGRRLVVAGIPGVAVIDVRTDRVLAASTTIPFVFQMALSPDGTRIAVTDSPPYPSQTSAGTIALLDTRTLRQVGTVGPALDGDTYTAVAFSPDGTRLAFGTNQGSAGVFDLRSGNQLVRFPGHTTDIFDVAFSPDGSRVATAAGDGHTYVWRAAGNQSLSITTGGVNKHADGFLPADITYTGSRVVARYEPVAVSGRQLVRSWTADGVAGRPLWLGQTRKPSYVRLSVSGRFALAGAETPYGTISKLSIWDTLRRRIVGHLRLPEPYGNPCCPALSPDGTQVVFDGQSNTGRHPPWLMLTDVATGSAQRLGTSPCDWSSFSFSSDGRRVAASDICGHVGVWDTATGKPVGHLLRFIGYIDLGPLAFSADDRTLAVANSGNLGQVSLVNIGTGQAFAVLKSDTQGIRAVAFSRNGALVATASLDDSARIWDAHTGQELRILDDPAPIDSIAFSPDSRTVATFDYSGGIDIWNACRDCRDPAALLTIAARRLTRRLTPDERRTFLG